MGYLLIFAFSFLGLAESILLKTYAKKHGSGGMIMNAVISLFAMFFFLITDEGGFAVPLNMIPLAIANSLFYASGFYLSYMSYRCGPYGLTRLISSFSLIFTIFYGMFFLNEKTNVLTYLGIIMIFASLALINYGKKEGNEEKRISKKWLISILISTTANGFIGILTRYQQIKFDNSCTNEFLALSLGGSFLLLTIIGILTERKNLRYIARHGSLYGMSAGIINGAKNLALVIAYLYVPLSIASPMHTGIGISLTFLTSLLFYREKYTKLQLIGVLLGAAAVIMLAC